MTDTLREEIALLLTDALSPLEDAEAVVQDDPDLRKVGKALRDIINTVVCLKYDLQPADEDEVWS